MDIDNRIASSGRYIHNTPGSYAEVSVFFQTRVGYRGKLFRVFKFKTLTDARDPEGLLLPDDLRSFPLGTFLRRYSLDELPQLVNIIKGDMSIVGPRPWIPDQLDVFPAAAAWRAVPSGPD